jgi:predicted TIM-barrel fold metal-dependent hydrolase
VITLERDGDVVAWSRDLGLDGIIDVHTHFMPPRMTRSVWAYFDTAGPLIGRPWPITYKWDESARVAHLRTMGVRAWSALAYAHVPGMAESLNEWTLDFADRTPECLPSITFFPEPGAAGYVRAGLERGARIAKLHLQVGGFDPNDPLLDPVWGLLSDVRLPIVVHAGSGPAKAGYTGPDPFGAVLKRFPDLSAIIAHMGAPEYDGFFDLVRRYPNVRLDTTMVGTDFFDEMAPVPASARPFLRDIGLDGRILLGSDFPNIPYPYAHQLASLARLDLGEDWLRAVCWSNPRSLFPPLSSTGYP